MSSALVPPLAGVAAAIVMVILHLVWPRTAQEDQVVALLGDGPKMMPELLWQTSALPVALAVAVCRLMASKIIVAEAAPPAPNSGRPRAVFRLVEARL